MKEKVPRLTKEQLAIINADGAGKRYEWWNDDEMIVELEQISADMDSGRDKGFTLEEIKERLLKREK